MKTITINGVPAELAAALESEKRRRGISLNRTVLALLRETLGLPDYGGRSNGLRHLSRAWSEEEYQEFKAATEFSSKDQQEQ